MADGAAAPASPASTSAFTTTATFNSAAVTPTGVQLQPGAVGIAQAIIPIPAGLPTGSYSLTLTVNGVTSPAVTVFVQVAPLVISTAAPQPVGTREFLLQRVGGFRRCRTLLVGFPGGATSFNGMSLDSTGFFCCSPNAASTTSVPVQVTDSNSPPGTVTALIPWTVYSGININLPANNQGTLIPTVLTNTFASFTISASGGTGGPYTWGDSAPSDSARSGTVPVPNSPQALLRRNFAAAARPTANPPIRTGKQVGSCFANPPYITTMGMDINSVHRRVLGNAHRGLRLHNRDPDCRYRRHRIGTFFNLLVADPVVITTAGFPPAVIGQPYNIQGALTLAASGGDPDDPSPLTWSASPRSPPASP